MQARQTFTMPDPAPGRARRMLRFITVLTLAGIFLALSLRAAFWVWDNTYSPPQFRSNGPLIVAVQADGRADRAGLRVGDQLAPDTPFAQRIEILRGIEPAGTLHFRIVRDGRILPIALITPRVSDSDPTYNAWATVQTLRYLIFALVVLMGASICLLRPSPLSWAFFFYCLGPLIPSGATKYTILSTVHSPVFALALNDLHLAFIYAGFFGLVYFALCFPNTAPSGWRIPVSRFVLGVAPVAIAAEVFLDDANWLYGFGQAWYLWSERALPFVFAGIVIASFAATYRNASGVDRQRLRWALLGTGFGSLATAASIVVSTVNFLSTPTLTAVIGGAATILQLSIPLSLSYATYKYRVVDIDFVINRTVVYAIVTSVLAISLASSYWLIGVFLQETKLAAALQLLAAIAIGVALQRLYRRIEGFINGLFFKRIAQARDYLARLALALPLAESEASLERMLTVEPHAALELTHAAVFKRTAGGSFELSNALNWPATGPSRLQPGDPLIAQARSSQSSITLSHTALATLALPIFVNQTLEALVLFGNHTNGTELDRDEINALQNLALPAAQAYAALRQRLDNLRRLSDVLENLGEAPYDQLHYYLADQLIASIPDHTRSALLACSAIPNATTTDVVLATGDEQTLRYVTDFSSNSPLIRKLPDATFVVHPLVAAALLNGAAQARHEMCARAADGWLQRGQHNRAAELFLCIDMHDAAAAQLEKHYAGLDPVTFLTTSASSTNLQDFTLEELRERPFLRLTSLLQKRYSLDQRTLANEARVILAEADHCVTIDQRAFIAAVLAESLAHTGDATAALAHLQSENGKTGSGFESALRSLPRAILDGRHGKLSRTEQHLPNAASLLNACSESSGARLLAQATLLERTRGHRSQERSHLEDAVDVLETAHSNRVVVALAEAAIGAWIAGEDSAHAYAQRLIAAIERYGANTFAHLAGSLMGTFPEPLGIEPERLASVAHLIQAAHAPGSQATHLAGMALEEAQAAAEPWLVVLASVALSLLERAQSSTHLKRAFHAAKNIESEALQSAIARMVSSKNERGMLEGFASQYARAGAGEIRIEIASGTIYRDGVPLAVPERELALAVALARSAHPVSAAELADLIWPELEENAALRAVQTYVHRLRQRLQDNDALLNTVHGYALSGNVHIDLREIEALLAGTPKSGPLEEFAILELNSLTHRLAVSRPRFMIDWQWFESIERRIADLDRRIQYRLAEDALLKKNYEAAIAHARGIVERDELDEPARELLIRAHLGAGENARALREFRLYRDIIKKELGAEPPAALAEMFRSMI